MREAPPPDGSPASPPDLASLDLMADAAPADLAAAEAVTLVVAREPVAVGDWAPLRGALEGAGFDGRVWSMPPGVLALPGDPVLQAQGPGFAAALSKWPGLGVPMQVAPANRPAQVYRTLSEQGRIDADVICDLSAEPIPGVVLLSLVWEMGRGWVGAEVTAEAAAATASRHQAAMPEDPAAVRIIDQRS